MRIPVVLAVAIELLVLTAPFCAAAQTRDTPTTRICSSDAPEVAEGNDLVRAGRFVEGRAKLQSALSELERGGALAPVRTACLMNALGFLEFQLRRADLAIEWFQRALELKPLPDVVVAQLTGNLAGATLESDVHQLDRAEELTRRAIKLSERALGPDHPETTFTQSTLALVHFARGDYARAEPVLRRVLYVAERTWSPSSYEVALAAGNLAYVYFAQGRHSLARGLYEKSLAGLEKNPIRSKDEILLAQASLAASCAAGGRHGEARMWVARVLGQGEREPSPESVTWPLILERVATARLLLREYESGRQMFDRSIAILNDRYGAGAPQVQSAFERYAEVLRHAGDKTGRRMLQSRLKASSRH